MWIAIRERTREIGTLRAIGHARGGVLRMFLYEFVAARTQRHRHRRRWLGSGLGAAINAARIHVPLSVQALSHVRPVSACRMSAGCVRAALFHHRGDDPGGAVSGLPGRATEARVGHVHFG